MDSSFAVLNMFSKMQWCKFRRRLLQYAREIKKLRFLTTNCSFLGNSKLQTLLLKKVCSIKYRHWLLFWVKLTTDLKLSWSSIHADRQDVDMSVTVCVSLCTVTDFSTADKASGANYMHGGSWASKAGNLTFWGTSLPQKPQIGRIGQRAGHACPYVNITVERRRRKRRARDTQFVKSRGMWTLDRHSPKTDVLVVNIWAILYSFWMD